MLIVVWIRHNTAFELKIILTYAFGNGPLKIQRQAFIYMKMQGFGG